MNPNTKERQKARGTRRKLKLISMMGGGCSECGYNKNLAALDFHHADPKEKSFELDRSKLSNSSWKTIWAEAEKCILLCGNYHQALHSPHLNLEHINVDKILKTAEKPIPVHNYCCDCGSILSHNKITRCIHCEMPRRIKITWPPTAELLKMVEESSYVAAGRKLGVSDNAIRKRIKNHPA